MKNNRFPIWVATSFTLGALVAAPGCASADRADPSALGESSAAVTAAGELTLIVAPPESALDWSSPGSLARTAAAADAAGEAHRLRGEVGENLSVGHVYVRMRCGDTSIETTGQTLVGSALRGGLMGSFDGAGTLFHRYSGRLNETAAAEADIEKRTRSGRVRFLSFRIRKDTCVHLRGFLDEYVARKAYEVYGAPYRPRRWEGAGCTAFGLAFVEIGGLLRRLQYTSSWARQVRVGTARIADVGGDGLYEYGSNLRSPGAVWPGATAIRVSKWPVSPFSSLLSAWESSEDVRANVDAAQPNAVPLTLYDTQLMTAFIDRIHGAGGGSALGRSWAVRNEGAAPGLVAEALDAVHAPYEDAVDDLNAD